MFSQKSPIIVTANIINAIAGYLGLFFITRYIGITIWGFVAFGMGFTGIFSLATELGFSSAYTKSVSEGYDVRDATSTFFAVKLLLAIFFVIITISALTVWTDVLHRGFQNPIEYWVIIALIPYYFSGTLLSIPRSYYTSTFSPYRQVLPSITEAILRNTFFILIGIFYYFRIWRFPDADVAVIIASVYSITYTIYFLFMMHLGRPWHLQRPSFSTLKYFAAVAIPLAATSGIATINGNIDKVIIQFYWHADATSALYTSQIIGTALISFSGAITGFFLPILARRYKKIDMTYDSYDLERYVSLFILPFVIVLSLFSIYFLNIFSGGYRVYSDILVFVALGNYISIITSPFTSAVVASGKTWNIAKITTPSILANIALNFLFVPRSVFGFTGFSMGPAGTVFASFLTALADYIVYRYLYYRVEGKNNIGIIRQIIPALSEIAVGYLIIKIIKPYPFIELLGSSLLLILVFFLVAIAIREITGSEMLEFLKNLNPINIPKNIREERQSDKK
ncbi:oligosaccharide flippase family protein [Thermoplasma sp.]|uniref:oligosaccharide flippase family protein n=1 Tax=Thermoplasma sp. TaxID=1973142 RepID=UPI002636F1FF|nr:oligosaccharide flippase family protein [Thermoplasma sp.]